GDFVRVITFDDHFSRELCGGTHVRATGQIGFFKITSESAVAAGVRRIEAVTGRKAEETIYDQSATLHQIKELLNNPKDLVPALDRLITENSALKKEVEQAIAEKALRLKDELAAKTISIGDVQVIAEKVDLPNADAVKTLAYALRAQVDNAFLVLGAEISGKPSLTVAIADSLVKERGWNAGTIVRELAKEIQGGGGGQPFFATAGGKDAGG